MRLDRPRLAPYAFLLGLLSLVFGAGWFIVTQQAGTVLQVALGMAIAAAAAGVLLDPDRVRRFLSGRQARYGSNALLLTVSFAGLLVVANYLAANNEKSWDLTEDQQYSLSPETRELILTVSEPVLIKGFFSPDLSRSRDNVEPLLERYRQASAGKVDYQFIDPNRRPLEADQYGVSRDGSLVVVAGDRSELVSFANEREISSAILRVSQGKQQPVYFLIGHGERDLGSVEADGFAQAQRDLEAKNYDVAELNLLAQESVPPDASALVIAAPRRPLAPVEVEALTAYMSAGGRLMVLFEPTVISGLPLTEDPLARYLLETWGAQVRDDLIADQTSQLSLSVIAYQYGDHPITNRMGNLASYFPTARSLGAPAAGAVGVGATELVLSGGPSWGETDVTALTEEAEFGYDEGEEQAGPLVLALALQSFDTGGRAVVFGDSDFATNQHFLSFGNGDLFVNSLDWLVGQEELIQLTPRDQTSRVVVPPSLQTIGLLFLLTVVAIPGAFVGLGVSAWWQRRRRR